VRHPLHLPSTFAARIRMSVDVPLETACIGLNMSEGRSGRIVLTSAAPLAPPMSAPLHNDDDDFMDTPSAKPHVDKKRKVCTMKKLLQNVGGRCQSFLGNISFNTHCPAPPRRPIYATDPFLDPLTFLRHVDMEGHGIAMPGAESGPSSCFFAIQRFLSLYFHVETMSIRLYILLYVCID
jgi:hypothetical protein